MKTTKYFLISIVKGLCIFLFFKSISVFGQNKNDNLHNSPSDSLYAMANSNYQKAVLKKDTNQIIESLISTAYYYATQAKYKDSYDHLWQALLLAEKSKNLRAISTINQKLGRHFGYYGRKEEGLNYFRKAVETDWEFIKKDSSQLDVLGITYHQMCSFYRDLNEIEFQKQYLDSCKKYVNETRRPKIYLMVLMEEAVVLMGNSEFEKADKVFSKASNGMNENLKPYLVLFEYYRGVNYYHLKQTKKAEEKLLLALNTAFYYNAHLDFVPKIYQKLSEIYMDTGETIKAIEMLNKMVEVNFDFFDSRSDRNKSLLEIQDEQRLFNEQQEKEIQQIRLEELEISGKVLFFQRALLIVGILLLAFVAFYYVQYLNKKFKIEKELDRKKQEIEFEKVKEIIELKNKELATSALKLIAKDEIVDDFGQALKNKNWQAEPKELKSFIRSWDMNFDRNWEEFQSRFTAINSSFYKRLHENFPQLSSSDDKLCALIKLKLSSKEISRLLGLSNESVHTKRSRLRTKMGLERSVNLTEFLDKF